MKKLFFTAALAAVLTAMPAAAQQTAGAPEGGISAEMLAEISKGYQDRKSVV